jgi:hypothetical protein
MNIKFPQLIYFIDYGNKHLLIRFNLLPINQSLLLHLAAYQLTLQESNANLKQAFYNDPTDETLFNRTNKQLLGEDFIGYNEIINFKRYLDNLPHDTTTNFIMKLRDSDLQVRLEDFQIYGLKLCITDICNNYNSYQISLIEIITKYKDKVVSLVDEIKVEPVIAAVENALNFEYPPLENNLQDLLQLSPNNLTTFYISKYINNNISIGEGSSEKGVILMVPNFLVFTYQLRLEFYEIIKSIKYTADEINSRTRLLYNNLYNITIQNQEIFNSNTQNVYIILFLLYIYFTKLYAAAEIKIINLEIDIKDTFIPYLNSILKRMTPEGNKLIILKLNKQEMSNNFSSYKEALEPLVQKYKYLTSIDRKLFVENVITDLTKTNFKSPKTVKPLLTNPSIYEVTGVTPEYETWVKLSAGSYVPDPPLILSKYFDAITNRIIPNVDKHIDRLSLEPVSCLILMYDFVKLDDSKAGLDVLFKVVLPYMFDKYKLSKFLNFFMYSI